MEREFDAIPATSREIAQINYRNAVNYAKGLDGDYGKMPAAQLRACIVEDWLYVRELADEMVGA